jgi:hypothetical protein
MQRLAVSLKQDLARSRTIVRSNDLFNREGGCAMQNLRLSLLLVVAIMGSILVPAQCRAQVKCPWLNAATAAGVLGGEVQLSVTSPTNLGDVACVFLRKVPSGVATLRIDVSTLTNLVPEFALYRSHCDRSSIPLRAIGNEAYLCVPDKSHNAGEEQIIGRVRDRAFTLTVSRNLTAPATPNANEPSSDTRNTAEQIAGGLF